jgi:hypothetical protein
MPTEIRLTQYRRRAGFSAAEPSESAACNQTEPPNRLPASCGCLSQPRKPYKFFTRGFRFAFDNGGDHPGHVILRLREGVSCFNLKRSR